ncbi:MAG: NAD(P)H-binding protein [Actinomyces sp.]|uniref:NAD(P)H-binding protein n=1 Tax=Actinomyces sp. TaxID=29317 RepID=UPI0026DDB335|nr:NAD(P)H-binding protein [Actinomyces sp.]MDO4242453.1 NAD(P)H-binding protein [Actinomyces sp.]
MTSAPAAAGTVSGAVLLCAGGAFALRGDDSDCYPTARRLSTRGYHCFVVDYRVHPYTQAESGVDLAHGLTVRAQSRNAARARAALPAGTQVVEASPTDAAALADIVDGVDVVILTHGGDADLEHNYYAVIPALLEALTNRQEVHIGLMTSMYVSTPNRERPQGDWKRRAERLVRACGHPYTIVRPGWFDYQGPEDTQIDLKQGGRIGGQPGVDRHHIAQVLIEGALNPSGEHRTVEVFSQPGEPVTDFEALFATTRPDVETGRGILDRVLVPLEDEPARLRADIARFGS